MNKEQIQRARVFAIKYIKENPIETRDTWVDFEDKDLHFYFDEPDIPEYCGVWAYNVKIDNEGYRVTTSDSWTKILTYDLVDCIETEGLTT